MPHTRMVAKLKGMAAVSVLIGTRVYPISAVQGDSLPYITFQKISGVPTNTAGGTTKTRQTRLQVNFWADSYDGARALANAACGNEDELAPSGLSGWVDRQQCVWHMENDRDGPTAIVEGRGKEKAHSVIQDYLVWHE